MDKYTILCTELRGSAQSLNGNIDTLQKNAEKLQKAINKVTRGDYKASDLSSAYTAQTALTGSITRLGEICGAMNTAALQFSEASTELSGRANLTAYYMQHTDTLSYEGLMGTYSAAIASTGSAVAGYELVKNTLEENGYSSSSLGSVSNAVQDAIQREAEEQAKRAEEAKWAKIGLTGLVIVGGIVASVVTGGAAAPIVIGAISGAVMAGGNTAIDQYAEHGWNMDRWDYAEIGKDAFVGGVTGAATAWIGGNLTKGVTNLASNTQWGSTLLSSSNAYVRVGTGAVIGSASEVVSGVGSRGTGAFITTMIETDGDLGKSMSEAVDYAFDGREIAQDAVLGGLQGGKQQYSEWKTDRTAETPNTPLEQKIDGLERDTIDWERTANTASEEEFMRKMEAEGRLETWTVNPDLEDPVKPTAHLPQNTGSFSGEIGNSDFVPNNSAALAKMKEYGMESVPYRNNDADFTACSKHASPWGTVDGKVEIGHMTDQRNNGTWEYGRRPQGTSHDPNYDIGNFAQADNEVAKQFKDLGVTGDDIEKYRKANKLIWHESADGKTMMLVPEEIHEACRHSGGVSEMKYRMAWGDVTRPD